MSKKTDDERLQQLEGKVEQLIDILSGIEHGMHDIDDIIPVNIMKFSDTDAYDRLIREDNSPEKLEDARIRQKIAKKGILEIVRELEAMN